LKTTYPASHLDGRSVRPDSSSINMKCCTTLLWKFSYAQIALILIYVIDLHQCMRISSFHASTA